MIVFAGDPWRESRRGNYWCVDVVLVHDGGYREALATANGETQEIAVERGRVLLDAFQHRVESYTHGGKVAPLRAAAELKKLGMLL